MTNYQIFVSKTIRSRIVINTAATLGGKTSRRYIAYQAERWLYEPALYECGNEHGGKTD